MTSECPRCGSTFTQPSGKGRSRKYCSPDCHHTEFKCASCGAVKRGYPGKKFCSTECRVTTLTKTNLDPETQRSRGRRGGATRRGTASPGSYLKIEGKHEHRTVAAEVLGRPLEPGEIVHHEDRDKHNNDPRNLIVFVDQSNHARHHKLGHVNHEPCACEGIRLREKVTP